MKKAFRILSGILAACVTMVMAAGAVDTSAKDDGTVVHTGVATVVADDGSTVDKEYEFSAPADATEEELMEMNRNAAREAVYGRQGRRYIQSERIAYDTDFYIPRVSSGNGNSLHGTPNYTPEEIEIYMSGITGCSRVNIAIENDEHPNESDYDTVSVESYGGCRVVFVSTKAFPLYKKERYNFYFSGNTSGSADSVSVFNNYETA